ncbi:hypothetical protein SRHO_G00250120 [Serrasalmus rhombeus]
MLTEEEELELASLPPQLWASSKYDVGLIKDCEPVVITPKSAYRPRQAQYPLKPEAIKGIKPVFQALLQTGVIVPCPDSPGYCESPTIYNAALRDSLASLTLPEEVVLVQYVDDLLLSAPSRELCKQATQRLLQHLANNWHKASKNKLQYCKPEVTFLGHIITAGQK